MATVSSTITRIEKLPRKKCLACKTIKRHQGLDGDLVCWNCGEVKESKVKQGRLL